MDHRGIIGEGFNADDDGYIRFMAVEMDVKIGDFETYMAFFRALVELAEQSEGVMPILVLSDENKN